MSLLDKIESGDPATMTILAVIGAVIVLAVLFSRLRKRSAKAPAVSFSATDADDASDDADVAASPAAPADMASISDTNDSGDETDVVAAIMAAISSIMGDTGFRLRSIRRTGRTAPSWNLSGRDEYLATRL